MSEIETCNYLGLADHPKVRQAAAEAARGMGLDPAAMGAPTVAQRTKEERETQEPYLPVGAPFDVERESSIARAV